MTSQTYDGALQDQLISQYPNILNANEIKTIANDFLVIIKQGLKKDKQVKINKFGTFRIKEVKDRKGVNPQTGKKIIIKAHKRVFFKPTKALLERINASVLLDVKKIIDDQKQYKVAAKQIDNVAQLVIKEKNVVAKPEETDNKRIIAASLILGIVIAGVLLQFQPAETQTPFIPKTSISSVDSNIHRDNSSLPTNSNESNQLVNENSNLLASASIPAITNSTNNVGTAGSVDANLAVELFDEDFADDVLNSEDVALYNDVMYDEALASNEFEDNEEGVVAEAVKGIQDEVHNEVEILSKDISAIEATPYFAKKTHKLKYGDNLWNLAKNNYKAPILWPHIYHDNQEIIANPNHLKTNKSIVIPQLDGEYGQLSKVDKRNVAEGYWLLYEHYKKTGNQFSIFALLGVKQFDSSVIDENKQLISKQDMADFLAMAEA